MTPVEPVDANDAVLDVRSLTVTARAGGRALVNDVSLRLDRGEMRGVVGESGSGKSLTARAIVGLTPVGVTVSAQAISLAGRELTSLSEKQLRDVRGAQIGMVFQNPRTALHPMLTIQRQMSAVLAAHSPTTKRTAARQRSAHFLELVGIPNVARVAAGYPHELSGGLAQRVVIATALLSEPSVLIADEPTTGLDVTVQREILDLLADIRARLGTSILFITHDLSIVAQYCDTVSVMRRGSIVEGGPVSRVLVAPDAAYSAELMSASRLDRETIRA